MAGNKFFKDVPGKTEPQVQNDANRLQNQAEEKGKYVTVEAPGDVNVRATMTLSLSGTGTAFDQSYDIESVQHRFSIHDGYIMTVTAKNPGQGDDSGFGQQAPASDNGGDQSVTPDQGFTSSPGSFSQTPGGGVIGTT